MNPARLRRALQALSGLETSASPLPPEAEPALAALGAARAQGLVVRLTGRPLVYGDLEPGALCWFAGVLARHVADGWATRLALAASATASERLLKGSAQILRDPVFGSTPTLGAPGARPLGPETSRRGIRVAPGEDALNRSPREG